MKESDFMSKDSDYRAWTKEVRSAARSHLLDLRKQRLARRSVLKSDVGEVCAEVTESAPTRQVFSITASSVAEECAAQALVDLERREAALEHDFRQTPSYSNAAPFQVGEEALSQTSPSADEVFVRAEGELAIASSDTDIKTTSESSPPADADVSVVPDGNLGAEVLVYSGASGQSEADPASSSRQTCDLLELPGAGPGLVWLLKRCGIHTAQDLSTADPEKLAADLGLVGEVLDVEKMIELAGEIAAK